MTNGGGDVTVQSSGLVDQPGDQERQQRVQGLGGRHVRERRDAGATTSARSCSTPARTGSSRATRSRRSPTYSAEYGGPIVKNKLWFWGACDNQDINVGVLELLRRRRQGAFCQALIAAQKAGSTALQALATYDKLEDVQNCLGNDKTTIKDLQWKFNYQLNAANKFQYLFQSDNKYRNARDASATTQKEATSQQTSDKPWGLPLPTHSITHTLDRQRQAGVQQPVHLRARRVLPRLPGRAAAGRLRPEPLHRIGPALHRP